MVAQIDPEQLAAALAEGQVFKLIDVREPWELARACLPDVHHIPMHTLPMRLDELEALHAEAPLVMICHHGARSMQCAHFLERQGLSQVFNLRGGIDAWSQRVDPTVPRY